MAGVQKNGKKGSGTAEDLPRPSLTAQRLASLSSSSRSIGSRSQSFSKIYRPSGVPSVQSHKAKKVISFWFFPQIIKFHLY